MAELKYEITEHLGVIKEKKGGWNKELNLVSWSEGSPKYDVRDWSSDHKKMSKGITLTEEELLGLYQLIGKLFFPEKNDAVDAAVSSNGTIGNGHSLEQDNEPHVIEEEQIQDNPAPSDLFLESLMKAEKKSSAKTMLSSADPEKNEN
jgi:hypothetical protein